MPRPGKRSTCGLLLALGILLGGCEPPPDPELQSLTYLQGWFQRAVAGERDEALCHGLGLLNHPQFSCAEMLDYAARVDSAQRTVAGFRSIDCWQKVCGTFYEVAFTGHDLAGNELDETVLLKQDDGQLRVYWYRNDAMLQQLAASTPQEEAKAPQQVAYDELVARHPALYAYPPCYGQRPSSSNLAGELFSIAQADVEAIEALAATCPTQFCFALVGQKIAPLCPPQ